MDADDHTGRHEGDRRRTILFVVAGVVVIAVDRSGVLAPLLVPWTEATIGVTMALLDGTGMQAVRDGVVVAHPDGFAYEIHYRCTGFLALALYSVALATDRGSRREKTLGLAAGAGVLLCLNSIRLVHLFWVGVERPGQFRFVHEVLWQGAMVAAVLVSWRVWQGWVSGRAARNGFAAACGRVS